MIRLIATDIDGTLLPEGHTDLNPEYFDVIRKLHAHGVRFFFASGRHAVSMKRTFGPVQDIVGIISQNGSAIEYQGSTEVSRPIPTEWIREFWQDLSVFEDVDSMIDTAEQNFCPKAGSPMHVRVRDVYKYNISPTAGWDDVPDDDFSMLTVYHEFGADEFINTHGIREKWESRLDLVKTGVTWVDCTMPGINKGAALRDLCRKFDIDPKDTIAFGDNINDIPMIRAAGTGYAVDTALPEVKAAADRVIPGFEEHGVLQILKEVLASYDISHIIKM